MRSHQLAFFCLIFSASWVGCDQISTVETTPERSLTPLAPEACESQVIPDPECNTAFSPGGSVYDVYFDSLAVESTETLVSSYISDDESMICPRSFVGSTTGVTRDPQTGNTYRFSSYGTWHINWVESALYLLSGQGIYAWPPSNEWGGGWTAHNLTRPGGPSATIWIRSGRAWCDYRGNVTFIMFYGVRVRDQGLRQTSAGGEAGSDGVCHTEYVWIEIDYGDGTGWQRLWEGYATICE